MLRRVLHAAAAASSVNLTAEKVDRASDAPAPIRTFDDLRRLAMSAEPKHGVALQTTQLLVPGILVREIRIPAGTLLCGEVHRGGGG